MEKKLRHYPLDEIKRLVVQDKWEITKTALDNALLDFNMLKSDIKNVILNLQTRDFYKSMTTYHDSTLWQDVYRPKVEKMIVYLKLTILENETLVIQFKKK